jgi:hypothetical protein
MSSQVLLDKLIIDAQTTGTFNIPAVSSAVSPYEDGKMTGGALEFTFHVLFSSGSSTGVIKVETAHDPAFTGTWAVIATVTWATANTAHYVSLTGAFRALRLRFTADVTGGTASAWVIASSR